MKTMDLQAMGLTEMNEMEMHRVDGGVSLSDLITYGQVVYYAAKLWVKNQSEVLEQLGTDAEIAAMQYN